MKSSFLRHLVLLLVLTFAFSIPVSNAAAACGSTITGRIEHGKIVADNGRTYILSHNFRGRELINDHTGQRVEVHGNVSKSRAKNYISVDRIDHIYG